MENSWRRHLLGVRCSHGKAIVSHILLSPACLVFFKWGRYDHGNRDVRNDLLNFATEKLCQEPGPEGLSHPQTYAVLSQRLALDMNMPNISSRQTLPALRL